MSHRPGSDRTWLPPYGWWERVGPKRTTIRGWDWRVGGFLVMTFGELAMVDGSLRGGLIFLAVLVLIGAGVGWRIVVHASGSRFDWTWLGVPIRGVDFSRAATIQRVADAEWDNGGVCVGDRARGAEREFGSQRSALDVVYALRRAAFRHHLPGERLFTGYR